jgi:epoxyqueuosine reductase
MLMKLLLHTCCGPCGLYSATKLREEGYEVTLFFYNPNIFPEEEYQKRLSAVKEWSGKNNFELIEGPYVHNDWLQQVMSLKNEPEGGARCKVCFDCRLEVTAKFAQVNDFKIFATTLTSGRNKKADIINPLGRSLAKKYELEF